MEIDVEIPTGGTALDVIIAAADKDSSFNFNSTYFGNVGFDIYSIAGTATTPSCYWSSYYVIPGGKGETSSSLGFSNIVIPGNKWEIILRYEKV